MAPNMRSAERLETTEQRLNATDQEFNQSKTAYKKASKAFEDVRAKRMDLFQKAFQHISEQIGPVYRELTKTQSFPVGGKATLDVEDEDEPYLSGVKYHAMPPLKRFRDMEHLSGGEKTMAALALLFAVHTYAPSPFFVLDEVDAALDHANTTQLAQYVREHAGPGMQFVVISLKTGLFQNSETLVGIMRDQAVNSSRALTLDVSDDEYSRFIGRGSDANICHSYESIRPFDEPCSLTMILLRSVACLWRLNGTGSCSATAVSSLARRSATTRGIYYCCIYSKAVAYRRESRRLPSIDTSSDIARIPYDSLRASHQKPSSQDYRSRMKKNEVSRVLGAWCFG